MEDSHLYWSLLKEFTQGKVNKDQLDAKAKLYLGKDDLHLHNEFILGLVHNALQRGMFMFMCIVL